MRARTLTGAVAALLVLAIAVGGSAALAGQVEGVGACRFERRPAHRDDQLHRLAQPVQLHRVPGHQRDDHDLPAARPVRRRGLKFEGDWATSWKTSANGKDWTFKLGRRQVVGRKPMTADDAAWTINTSVKYAAGPTALSAGYLAHIKSATAVNPTTLVIHYQAPSGTSSPSSSSSSSCPSTSGRSSSGTNGKGLKTYHPELHLPMVTGGAYTDHAVREEGDDGVQGRPELLRAEVHTPRRRAHVLHERRLDDRRPEGRATSTGSTRFRSTRSTPSRRTRTSSSTKVPGAETTNITWNSNPVKPKNRELLDPAVKKALSMCVDRQQIIDVVFSGYASKVESSSATSRRSRTRTSGPSKYDCAAANKALDKLGYKRGSDGIRVAPATTGKYAQAAHPMSYEIVTPTSTDFNVDREFDDRQEGFAKLGVKVTQKVGGDTTATYAIETGDNCDAAKQAATRGSTSRCGTGSATSTRTSCSRSSRRASGARGATRVGQPRLRQALQQQGKTVDPAKRKAIVYKMQKIVYDNVYYTQLVNEQAIDAHAKSWTGIIPELNGYSKLYYTSPSKTT